ncbi:MAG: type II secretion system protein [Planctomycetota bacterium]
MSGGFSLVELLVVIAVTAILLGILLPSLSVARQQAKTVVCAARLRQWGIAFDCYAAENNAFWPHCDGLDRQDPPDPTNPDYHEPNISPADLADWHGWVDVLPPLISMKSWRYFGIGEHPREKTFYQCPTARVSRPLTLYRYYPLENGYFSYAMNSCLELDENTRPPPDGVNNMPSFLDTSKIVRPAQVVLLFDQLLDVYKGYDGTAPYRNAGKYCGSYPIAFAARHARAGSTLGGNILFCDGHVSWQRSVWKDDWGEWDIGLQQGPPRSDENWYPYPAEPTVGR